MIRTSLRRAHIRAIIAVSAAGVFALGSAMHVSADGTTGTGFSTGVTGGFVAAGSIGNHTLTVTGTFNGANNGNSLNEDFACAAVASPDAASVSISDCNLSGAPAVTGSLEGDAFATDGTHSYDLGSIPQGGLILCATATATYNEAIVGPLTVTVNWCSNQGIA